MRRLGAWIGGVLGGIAAYRWLRGRPGPDAAAEPSAQPAPSDPTSDPDERAEELRAKLAEKRDLPPPEDADARRRLVHEQARAALEEMRGE